MSPSRNPAMLEDEVGMWPATSGRIGRWSRAAFQPSARASTTQTLGLQTAAKESQGSVIGGAQGGPLSGHGMRADHPRPGVEQRQDVPGLGRGFQFIEQNDVVDLVASRWQAAGIKPSVCSLAQSTALAAEMGWWSPICGTGHRRDGISPDRPARRRRAGRPGAAIAGGPARC